MVKGLLYWPNRVPHGRDRGTHAISIPLPCFEYRIGHVVVVNYNMQTGLQKIYFELLFEDIK